jgi:hypothetical protein
MPRGNFYQAWEFFFVYLGIFLLLIGGIFVLFEDFFVFFGEYLYITRGKPFLYFLRG